MGGRMKKKVLSIIKEIFWKTLIMLLAWVVTYKFIFKTDFKLEGFLIFLVIYILGNITEKIITKRKEIKNKSRGTFCE